MGWGLGILLFNVSSIEIVVLLLKLLRFIVSSIDILLVFIVFGFVFSVEGS